MSGQLRLPSSPPRRSLTDAATNLNTPPGKKPGNDIGRALFLETDFRVRVQRAPDRDKIISIGGDVIKDRHGWPLPG